jgi:hypothetical protein
VATSAARYQNLSLNPSKLSGQCGRLKCCLNYELETYMDALEDIPKIEAPLQTEKGEATLQKTDIFRKIMWFGFKEENTWYPLNIERVNHILRMNREGKRPATLDIDIVEEKVMGGPLNSDLDQMDKKFKNKSRTKKKKKKGPENSQGRGNTNAQAAGAEGAAPIKDTHNAPGDQVQSGGGRQQQRNSGGGNNPQQKNNPQNRQGQGQGQPRGNREQRGGSGGEGSGGNREGRSRNRNRGNRGGGGQGRENRGGGEGQTPKPDNPQ